MTNLYEKLFDCATQWMLSDGGDGYSLIICRSSTAKDVADYFEKWQTLGLERTDHENGNISFDDPFLHQGICFITGPSVKDDDVSSFLASKGSDYIFYTYIFII